MLNQFENIFSDDISLTLSHYSYMQCYLFLGKVDITNPTNEVVGIHVLSKLKAVDPIVVLSTYLYFNSVDNCM